MCSSVSVSVFSSAFISTCFRCESESRGASQPGCVKLLTSHVLQTSRCNQSMAGWQIGPSMYSDKQISAKMLLAAYQMCRALVWNRRWKSVHVPSVLRRDHRCSNFCWTKWCKYPGWSRVSRSDVENTAPREETGGSPSFTPPYCTLSPGCDQDYSWILQPHTGFHQSCNGREKKKRNWKIQIRFSNSNFLVGIKLVQWQLGSQVTPPVWPEHCAPRPFDSRAGAGGCRPETHLYWSSHLLARVSRTLAARRRHAGSRLYPRAVSAQLFTGLLHWRDRKAPQTRDENNTPSKTGETSSSRL